VLVAEDLHLDVLGPADVPLDEHFPAPERGAIGGAGFTGFCFGIIIGGVVVAKVGYGWLVAAAFIFHIASAIVTFAAMAPENAAELDKLAA
jgi:hypothetical protein